MVQALKELLETKGVAMLVFAGLEGFCLVSKAEMEALQWALAKLLVLNSQISRLKGTPSMQLNALRGLPLLD